MDRESIYKQLFIAKENGYQGIVLTDSHVEFVNDKSLYKNYGFVLFDGMYIYDKYGLLIDRYQLKSYYVIGDTGFLRVERSYTSDNIFIHHQDGTFQGMHDETLYGSLHIGIDRETKMYPLQYLLETNKTYDLTINCDYAEIPPWIFESIDIHSLSLHKPTLNNDILRAIKASNVVITDCNYHDYSALGCSLFRLRYLPASKIMPIMPKEAYSITVIVEDGYSNLVFPDNNAIEYLNISLSSKKDFTLQIGKLSALSSLNIDIDRGTKNKISLDIVTLRKLDKLVYNSDISFIDDNGMIHLNATSGTLMKEFLTNMKIFDSRLIIDEQYILLPNIEKIVIDRELDAKYIPKELKEYVLWNIWRMTDNEFVRMKELEKHLFGMKSIKRMPLVISLAVQPDLFFDTKYDVLYDIYIFDDQNGNATNVSFHTLRNLPANKQDEVERAILHNERYLKRSRTLESFY